MQVTIKEWFRLNKWHEFYTNYHCQKLSSTGEVIGETEKAYKLTVRAMFVTNEKDVTIWAPKSACIAK